MSADVPPHPVALIALGSASQPAATQARLLRQNRALQHLPVIAVTAGTPGFLTALATVRDRWCVNEVADVYGRPTRVAWLLQPHGTALIDAAQLVTAHPHGADQNLRDVATSYGIGQLLSIARSYGANHVIIGATGFPGGDAGAGAAHAAGARLRKQDGSGVKVGANELGSVNTFVADMLVRPNRVTLLCDTETALDDITTADDPRRRFADAMRVLTPRLGTDLPRSGAYDGLAYGLAVAFQAELVDAATYGVTLHDPTHEQRVGQVLIGAEHYVDMFTKVYGTRTATVRTDTIDARVVDELLATVATVL